jgi:uncharacterized protein YjbI with pentapeptide repeats
VGEAGQRGKAPAFSAPPVPAARALPEGTVTFLFADLSGQHAAGVTFTGARLTRVALGGTNLADLRLIDVQGTTCDLANGQWSESRWERTACHACRAVGLLANEASLRGVLFRDSDLRLAQFRFARCEAVRFEGCILREADFHGADLSGVVFARGDLRDADLSGATLVGADLRGSQIGGARLGVREVRGLIVDPLQLLELVAFLGITVLPGQAGEALPADGERVRGAQAPGTEPQPG